jgi:glycogen debranching enzyme
MVKIVNSFKNLTIEKNIIEDNSFILTNKKGSYTYFAEKPESRYQGVFFFDNFNMYKVIENINLIDSKAIIEIRNNFYSIDRKRKSTVESFFMPYSLNSLVYKLNKEKEIEITLDVKESYDNRIWGRYYNIFVEKGCIVVEFTKSTDRREDNSDGIEEYKVYLAIKWGTKNHQKIEKWVERYYKLDEQRNSIPFTRYVFCALKLKGKKFVFSISKDKENAIKECKYVFSTSDKLKQKQKKYFVDNILKNKIKHIKNKDRKFAYISAMNSLESLIINYGKEHGILAGLPWFFHFWSRDTVISSKSLFFKQKIRKKVLFDVLNTLQDNGRVVNIYCGSGPGGGFEPAPANTADATGWTFFRVYELYKKKKLTTREIEFVKRVLLKSIKLSKQYLTKEGFEINNDLETWMDTSINGIDTRLGIRIEIQALRLNMYKFAYGLTKHKKYKNEEIELRKNVREKFWNGEILADGINDFTIRPNIFIAAYVYPNLLTKKEWIKCFENALTSLWLKFGGLSTIDKRHYLFTDHHTGENNKSYHRGDSWFWLNNLAALVLHNLDKNKFKKYINKILKASTNEILWGGAISHHSELSSASNLKSQGCLMQAWSNAMYIELINELYK